jgi:hypothetical protein
MQLAPFRCEGKDRMTWKAGGHLVPAAHSLLAATCKVSMSSYVVTKRANSSPYSARAVRGHPQEVLAPTPCWLPSNK